MARPQRSWARLGVPITGPAGVGGIEAAPPAGKEVRPAGLQDAGSLVKGAYDIEGGVER